MDYYFYNVDMPFSGTTLYYRQLKSIEQLNLSKADVLLTTDEESNITQYSKIVKKIIVNCIEDKTDFYKLDLIEYILFLIKLRSISIDNNIEFCLEEKDFKNKITINCNDLIKNIFVIAKEALSDSEIYYKDIKVKLKFPNIKNELLFYKNLKEKTALDILNTIPFFIDFIEINNKKIILSDMKNEQIFEIYENLPINLKNKMSNKVLKIIKKLSEKNIFNIKKLNFNLSFYNFSYQELIRILLSSSLKGIYKDYYILASKHINPSFIDNISIPERIIFCEFVKEELEELEKLKSEQSEYTENMTSLESLMGEFNEYEGN
jgi:hypothetical protein